MKVNRRPSCIAFSLSLVAVVVLAAGTPQAASAAKSQKSTGVSRSCSPSALSHLGKAARKDLRVNCAKAKAHTKTGRGNSHAADGTVPAAAIGTGVAIGHEAAGGSTPAAPKAPTTTGGNSTPPGQPAPPVTPPSTPEVPTSESSGFAIGIDGGYSGWNSAEIQMRSALGAASTRHEWSPSESVTAQDALVEAAAGQVHTRLHALIALQGTPSSYATYVVAFIKRYGAGGSFWASHPSIDEADYAITEFELGNEPYFEGWEGAQYAAFIRPALEAVKSQNLPAKMIIDSRTYGTEARYVDPLYAAIPNLNQLIWAFAEHPYDYGSHPDEGGAASPFERLEVTRAHINAHGGSDKPILVTEYGQSTANCGSECTSESQQAEDLEDMIAFCQRPSMDIAALYVYQLIDRGTGSSDRELQFGLLRQNGTPKPAYSLVKSAATTYRAD